jgi:hypothetical protein
MCQFGCWSWSVGPHRTPHSVPSIREQHHADPPSSRAPPLASRTSAEMPDCSLVPSLSRPIGALFGPPLRHLPPTFFTRSSFGFTNVDGDALASAAASGTLTTVELFRYSCGGKVVGRWWDEGGVEAVFRV